MLVLYLNPYPWQKLNLYVFLINWIKKYPNKFGILLDLHYLCTQMNKSVLNSIRELLAQTLPPNATAWLYGSQARGDAHRGSDWDILIVMDKDRLLPDDYDTITYPLTKLGWELGAEINPIMYTKKEWEQSRITPFYHNVEQDAIALSSSSLHRE